MEQIKQILTPTPKNRPYWILYWLAVVVFWLIQVYPAFTTLVVHPTGSNLTRFLTEAVAFLAISGLFVGVIGGFCFATVWGVRRINVRVRRWLLYLAIWVFGVVSALAFVALSLNGSTLVRTAETGDISPLQKRINAYPGNTPVGTKAIASANTAIYNLYSALDYFVSYPNSSNPAIRNNTEDALFKAEAEVAVNTSKQATALAPLLPRVRAALNTRDRAELAKLVVELKLIQ